MNKNNNLDFPFYNDNPKISTKDIIILALTPILFTIYTFSPLSIPFGLGPYVFCLGQLAAFLYVAKGNVSLLVKKLKFKDFVRIFLTLILQYIVAIAISATLKYVFKIPLVGNEVVELEKNLEFWIKVIFQLFGEELYKILIFLVALILMYKKTKNRKLSITVAVITSLLCFAIVHLETYNNIIHVLLLQGVPTLICLYNYLKTKNILTSYLQHLLFDAIPFILAMFISFN